MKPAFDVATLRLLRHEHDLDVQADQRDDLVLHDQQVDARIEAREAKEQEAADFVEAVIRTQALDPAQARRFGHRIEAHQQGLVEALLENQRLLDLIQDQIDAMLEDAYVLDDGRRVFKTEDGERVFDEHGIEVDMDADLIDDRKPRWERYRDSMDSRRELSADREDMLDYQLRLDEAEARLERGEASADDLDDLLMDAPTAVRSRLPSHDEAALDPARDASTTMYAAFSPADLDTLSILMPGQNISR